jgi:hypothetical protein
MRECELTANLAAIMICECPTMDIFTIFRPYKMMGA